MSVWAQIPKRLPSRGISPPAANVARALYPTINSIQSLSIPPPGYIIQPCRPDCLLGGLHGDRCHAKLHIRPPRRRTEIPAATPSSPGHAATDSAPAARWPPLKLGSASIKSQCYGRERIPRNHRPKTRQCSAETCSWRVSLARACTLTVLRAHDVSRPTAPTGQHVPLHPYGCARHEWSRSISHIFPLRACSGFSVPSPPPSYPPPQTLSRRPPVPAPCSCRSVFVAGPRS